MQRIVLKIFEPCGEPFAALKNITQLLKRDRIRCRLSNCLDFKLTDKGIALSEYQVKEKHNAEYTLRQSSAREIVLKKKSVDELTDSDFVPSFKQKGVDMRIGMDIASLSYKKQVNQIVLIAGDADFVPAAKLARREGIDFVLDPLGHPIKDDLFEHIDGKRSCGDPYQVARTKIKNKVSRSSN